MLLQLVPVTELSPFTTKSHKIYKTAAARCLLTNISFLPINMSHLPVFDLKPYKFFEISCVFLYVFESLLQLEKNSWIDREKKRRDKEKKRKRKDEKR